MRPVAAGVGESSIGLRAGERLTVGDLVEAALIQSANDAAYALAAYVGGGDVERVRAGDEREGAQAPPPRHALRPSRRARRARRVLERSGRIAARAHRDARPGDPRGRPPSAAGRSPAAARCTPGTICSASFPGCIGVKTGHTGEAGWCEVAAARGRGYTIYATILGSPSRDERNAEPRRAPQVGPLPVPSDERDRAGPHVRARRRRAMAWRLYGSSPRRRHDARCGSAARSSRTSSPRRRRASRSRRRPARRRSRLSGQASRRNAQARRGAHGRAPEHLPARVGFYARHTAKHVLGWFS